MLIIIKNIKILFRRFVSLLNIIVICFIGSNSLLSIIEKTLLQDKLKPFTSSNKFSVNQKYDVVLYPAPERVLPISYKVPGIAVVNSVLSALVEGKKDWIQKIQIKKMD